MTSPQQRTAQTAGEDTTKTKTMSGLLHKVLEEVDEPLLMELAARTLGRLVKSGAAMTSEIVDREVRACGRKRWWS
jgi:FKBP12-rapamycin complex-associated protein